MGLCKLGWLSGLALQAAVGKRTTNAGRGAQLAANALGSFWLGIIVITLYHQHVT
jgi:hypothetical protein